MTNTSIEVAVVVTTDKAPTGGGQYISVIGRRVTTTTDYRAKIRFAAVAHVWLTRNEGATETVLTTRPCRAHLQRRRQAADEAPDQRHLADDRAGQDLEGRHRRACRLARTTTDSTAGLQAAGAVGLYPYVSATTTNGPVAFTYDDLWVGPVRP